MFSSIRGILEYKRVRKEWRRLDVVRKADKDKLKLERQGRKQLRQLQRRGKREYYRGYVAYVHNYRKYKRLFRDRLPSLKEARELFTTPVKCQAFVDCCIKVTTGRDITEKKDILKHGEGTDKGLCILLADILEHNGFETMVYWAGYAEKKVTPFCLAIDNKFAYTVCTSLHIHLLNSDVANFGYQVLHDLYPTGNRWIIMDKDMSHVEVSYSDARKWAGPRTIIYDHSYNELYYPTNAKLIEHLKFWNDGAGTYE